MQQAADDTTREALAAFTVAELANAAEGRGVIDPGLQRYSGTGTVAGRAVTAACDFGSLAAVWSAVEGVPAGGILCIHGPGVSAYMGDLLAGDLVNRGFVAAVVDGYIRDRATLAAMPMTFMARGLYPMAHRREGNGQPQAVLSLGGVAVHPGDWIVADDDGVIVIVPEAVEAVLSRAHENEVIEQGVRRRVMAGASLPQAVRDEFASRAG